MTESTLGKLLLKDAVPEDLRASVGTLNSKGLRSLFQLLADAHPEKYKETAKKLSDLAAKSAYESGGYSFGPEHLEPPPEVEEVRNQYKNAIQAVLDNPTLTEKSRNDALVKVGLEYMKPLQDAAMKAGLKYGNPLALQIDSGAKGKPDNLKSLQAGDTLYTDSEYEPVPIPVTSSLDEGMRPHEYVAGTFGARLAITLTKLGTAAGGYLSKRLNNTAHRLVVSAKDAEQDPEHPRGYEVNLNDPDNEGSLLAHPAGGYPRNTVLDGEVMKKLKAKGVENVLVRSPMVGGPADGGVYANDVGIRERGRIAPLGDQVGMAAAQSLCLAKGTLVRMADGSDKPIEEIRVGESVLGSDRDGKTRPVQVTAVHVQGEKECDTYYFNSPEGGGVATVVCTPFHKFLTVEGEVRCVGNVFSEKGAVRTNGYLDIAEADYAQCRLWHTCGVRETFDITVDHPDHLFVLASGLIVSNSEPITQTIIGSKHCLKVGTLVRMADWSTKSIETIAVGESVLGSDMAGKTFPVRVVNVYDNGTRECVRTTFSFGKRNEDIILESTEDHKILATTFMSSCKEAVMNDIPRQLPLKKTANKFFAVQAKEFTALGFKNEPRAMLLGLLLGDGCYTESLDFNPHLSCADETLLADLVPYLAGFNLKTTDLDAGGGLMRRLSQIEQVKSVRDADTGKFVEGYRNPAKLFLDSFGILGKYSYEKSFPQEVYGWDNESVALLISGLFITDGSVYNVEAANYPYASFGSTSQKMIEQTRELLKWRFGISTGQVKKNNTGRKRTLYSIEVARFKDVKRLQAILTLLGVKKGRYAELVAAGDIRLSTIDFKQQARVDKDFRLRRRSKVEIGSHRTYDIEVDHPDHLFVLANGLIVSNSGGVAGATAGQQGFPVLDRLFSIPASFPGGSVHAQRDGTVDAVREAPHGGNYIIVDGEEHYADPALNVKVKPGDKVEAGDPMTDGLENPSQYVKHKHIGEARKRFVDTFMEVAQNSGFRPHRRNVELVARGLIDHVKVDGELGDLAPGDVTSYTALENEYRPREGHKVVTPKEGVGMYLEKPVLHHTIGTRVTKSMLPAMERYGVNSLTVHPTPAPFTPTMIRSQETINFDKDWMTRMLGSGLEKNLLKGVARGDSADLKGTSWVAPLSEAAHFGLQGKVKAWPPENPS